MALSDRLYGKTKVPVKTFDFKEQIKQSVQSTQAQQPKKTPTPQPKLTPQQISNLQKMKESKQKEITDKAKKDKAKEMLAKQNSTPKVPYGTKGYLVDAKGKNLPRVVNPVAAGVTKVASFGTSSLLPGMKEAEAQAQKQFPKSYIAGQVLGYAGPTGLATGLTKGLVKGATKKLATETGKRVVEGAIVGTTAEATQIVKPLITKEITPEQAAKQLATGLVAGAGLDIGIGVLGKALKALPKSTMNKIKSGATLSSAEKNNIVAELGLPKGTTADDYIRQMQDLANDIEIEKYYKQMERQSIPQRNPKYASSELPKIRPEIASAKFKRGATVSYMGDDYVIIEPGVNKTKVADVYGNETIIPKQFYEDLKVSETKQRPIKETEFFEDIRTNDAKKLIQEDHPETAIYYKNRANELLNDINSSVKGERVPMYDDQKNMIGYEDTSSSRLASNTISNIIDDTGATYGEIKEALKIISKGEKGNALAKRIETFIDDDLINGYKTIEGEQIPSNIAFKSITDKLSTVSSGFPDTHIKYKRGKFDKTHISYDKIVKPLVAQEQIAVKPITQATEQPIPIVKPLIEPTATPQVKTHINEPQGVKSVAESFDVPKTESLNVPLREPVIPTANKIKDDGLGTAEQLRERIVSDVKKPKKSFDEFWKKAESQFIDDTAPLKHLEKKIKGKVSSAEESIYKTAGLYRGAPERASEIVRTGIKPAIQIAENAGFDHKDLRDYAIAVHAKEVNEAGINSGISTSSADDTIRKFGTPEMEAARQQLIKVSNKLVDDMFENGLLTKESYEGLKNKWKNYMPLFREFDDNQVPKAFGMSDKLSGASAPIKGLVGSERKVIDPLQGMIKNIYATENAIARNKVGLQLAKLSDIDVENRFIRKLDNGEEVGRKNVVNVMIDGKKVGYEVEPEVYKMLQGLDKETSNWIISIMSKPASVLRAGATLTPEFALRNPMRDVMNAYVISKSGFNPIIDFPRGLASVMKKDEYYEQFLKENGGFGNIFSMDRQSHKDALEKIIKQPNSKKFVNILNPNSYIELLRSVSDVTESATKVGEFRKALSKGETPQEAAYRARNLMDFGKAGSSIRPANKVVAFLNANIRGKATLIEAIKENPVKVTGKLMASMVLPTVAFKSYNNEYANENQKQTIKDAPQWLKDTFWLVAVPGTDTVARIPKPFDIAAVANGTDRFIDYVVGNDKEAFDGFAKNTIKGSSIPVMMTGVLPILEAMSNYSQFKQGPIIPEREKFLPRKYQSDSKTSELAKIVAGGIGKVVGEESNFSSPRTIDYVIRSSTGGLGSTALDAADWVAKSTGLVKKPPKPSVGITGLPIVKGFTVSELSSGKSVGDLYDLKNKLTTEKGGLKFEAKKSNKDPKKVKYENEETYKFVNDITDEISDISKEMRDVTEDMNMSPEEKRVKLKELNDKRNKLSYEALTKAKKMLDKNNR